AVAITSSSIEYDESGHTGYLTFSGLEGLAFDSVATYNVRSTSATTPVKISPWAGSVIIGSGANTLDSIQGAVTVQGGGGALSVNLNDGGASTGCTYTLTPTTASRPGAATVTYTGATILRLS